jgi:hypothetical protein
LAIYQKARRVQRDQRLSDVGRSPAIPGRRKMG